MEKINPLEKYYPLAKGNMWLYANKQKYVKISREEMKILGKDKTYVKIFVKKISTTMKIPHSIFPAKGKYIYYKAEVRADLVHLVESFKWDGQKVYCRQSIAEETHNGWCVCRDNQVRGYSKNPCMDGNSNFNVLLEAPLKVGHRWKIGEWEGKVSFGKITNIGVKVSTPVGIFKNCIEVTAIDNCLEWFAPGVGKVKAETPFYKAELIKYRIDRKTVTTKKNKYELLLNYPDLSSKGRKIYVNLPIKRNITLRVYDLVSGKEETFKKRNASKFIVSLDSDKFPASSYYVGLSAGRYIEFKKVITTE
ncbi:MAG: hypothetical protein WC614_05155 [bacterium]